MDKFYKVVRINETEATATVLLKYGETELQQDLELSEDMTEKDFEKEVKKHLDKLQEDIDSLTKVKKRSNNPTIQALVNKELKVLK